MIKIGAETRDKIGIGMTVNMDFAQDDLTLYKLYAVPVRICTGDMHYP